MTRRGQGGGLTSGGLRVSRADQEKDKDPHGGFVSNALTGLRVGEEGEGRRAPEVQGKG